MVIFILKWANLQKMDRNQTKICPGKKFVTNEYPGYIYIWRYIYIIYIHICSISELGPNMGDLYAICFVMFCPFEEFGKFVQRKKKPLGSMMKVCDMSCLSWPLHLETSWHATRSVPQVIWRFHFEDFNRMFDEKKHFEDFWGSIYGKLHILGDPLAEKSQLYLT